MELIRSGANLRQLNLKDETPLHNKRTWLVKDAKSVIKNEGLNIVKAHKFVARMNKFQRWLNILTSRK